MIRPFEDQPLNISNAVRFPKGCSLNEAAAWVNTQRPVVRELIYQNDVKKLIAQAVSEYDRYVMDALGWRNNWNVRGEAKFYPSATPFDLAQHMIRQNDAGTCSEKAQSFFDRTDTGRNEVILFEHEGFVYGRFLISHHLEPWLADHLRVAFDDFSFNENLATKPEMARRGQIWESILGEDTGLGYDVGIVARLGMTDGQNKNHQRFFQELREGNTNLHNALLKKHVDDRAERVLAMALCTIDAPWLPKEVNGQRTQEELWKSHLPFLISLLSGKNEAFNRARDFFAQEALDHDISLDLLLTPYAKMDERIEKKKVELYQKNVPMEALTPSFEQAVLDHHVSGARHQRSVTPKSKL